MNQMELPNSRLGPRRRGRRRGQELLEFCFIITPLFGLLFVELDITWGVYVKATMEQACRVGARYGITNAVPDPNHPELCSAGMTLTDCVKEHVQWAAGAAAGTSGALSGGLLGGSTAFSSWIKVEYFQASGGVLSAVTGAGANAGGNVLMVSINNYPLTTLVTPYIVAPSNTPTGTYWVTSADTLSSVLVPPSP